MYIQVRFIVAYKVHIHKVLLKTNKQSPNKFKVWALRFLYLSDHVSVGLFSELLNKILFLLKNKINMG